MMQLRYFGQLLWGPALDELAGSGGQRRYYMLGGKVGGTRAAAGGGLSCRSYKPSGTC